MNSIYHFFKSLLAEKQQFLSIQRLEVFPFPVNLLSCNNAGQFPDMAIKLNKGKPLFTGGELIELKDSQGYGVSSFNSTIPTGKKVIAKVIKAEGGLIAQQMITAGDEISSLPVREVFYLIRGRKKNQVKVALVHGSFFETIKIDELISKSISQVLEDRLQQTQIEVSQEVKDLLATVFSEQQSFSKVRKVDKASVKLRFWVSTEVKAEGNILNPQKYPELGDNTLNFVVPCHSDADEKLALKRIKSVFSKDEISTLKIFKLKHHFNGYFLVFQTSL
jgi:hypothetical protein